jgi:hypothetical protein
MLRIYFMLFFLIPVNIHSLFAQDFYSFGARSASLGNASVAVGDVWSQYSNPAALVLQVKPAVATFYENKFLIPEFQLNAIVGSIPYWKGVFSVGGQFFGLELVRIRSGGLSYGFSLNEFVSLGLGLHYQQSSFQEDGLLRSLTTSIGMLTKLSNKWMVAASLANLGGMRKNDLSNMQSLTLRIGGVYKSSEVLQIMTEVEKNSVNNAKFKLGLEYSVLKVVQLRLGSIVSHQIITGGVGILLKKRVHIDFSSQWHTRLGFSPSIGIRFQ